MKTEKLLTETELEMMRVLWAKGEGTVNDVLEALPSDRDLAYTSVSTILRILEKKNFLKSRKDGRSHIYKPRVDKSDYEGRTLRHVVQNVFDGERMSLVRQLLGAGDMKPEELAELRKLFDKGEKPS
ncbi:MAG: BlaI/MecI/CopY family transcriptional regulator [Bdellovibrionota bacterium]